MGFSGGSVSKESACNSGDPGSISESERSPGEGNGNPLHYSCLENPMNRGAWRATAHGVARVGNDLVTKPPPPNIGVLISKYNLQHVIKWGDYISHDITCYSQLHLGI